MTTVRPLCAGDLGAVQDLLLQSFPARLHPYMTYTQFGISRFLELRLDRPESFPGTVALVACDIGGQVVGFADFRIADKSAFLSYICVSHLARRSGIANTLIRRFLDIAPVETSRVELDVFDESHAALRMYDSLGFEAMSRQMWVGRALPPAATPIAIPSIKDVDASLRVYGFCDLTLGRPTTERRFGILGKRTLRCFAAADFGDDATLASLRGSFPALTTAFTIAPEGAAGDLPSHQVINRSTRLFLDLTSQPSVPARAT